MSDPSPPSMPIPAGPDTPMPLVIVSSPPSVLTWTVSPGEVLVAASPPATRSCAARPDTTTSPAGSEPTFTVSASVGAIGDDGVGLPVAAAAGRREVDVGVLEVGSGEIADRDVVGPAEGVQRQVLDPVHVLGDVGHVTEEPDARAVGGHIDVLVGV